MSSPVNDPPDPVAPAPTAPAPVIPPAPVFPLASSLSSNDWLKEFYKECGREVTLAYTTLNQMKNWAIVISAAIAAAVASIIKDEALSEIDKASIVFVASVLAFLFNVRFFVRAMLCYVNLLKWNEFQSRILRLKVGCDSRSSASIADMEEAVGKSIDQYYYRWLSPIGRWNLVTSNLKLGFGLLLVLPVMLMLWSGFASWDSCNTRIAAIVVVGASLIEVYEFFHTSFLDTPEVRSRRAPNGDAKNRFPSPTGNTETVALWLLLLVIAWFSSMYCSGYLCFNA